VVHVVDAAPDGVTRNAVTGRNVLEKMPTAVTDVGNVTVKLSLGKKKSDELNEPTTCLAARLFPLKLL
jgi:hypothetical protein